MRAHANAGLNQRRQRRPADDRTTAPLLATQHHDCTYHRCARCAAVSGELAGQQQVAFQCRLAIIPADGLGFRCCLWFSFTYIADSPAELLHGLLAGLLAGASPDLRDVVLLRSLLMQGAPWYAPVNAADQIKNSNLDVSCPTTCLRRGYTTSPCHHLRLGLPSAELPC